MSFNVAIPDLLVGEVNVSEIYQNYNARGVPTSFGIDLDFPTLLLSKTLKSSELSLLHRKVEDTLSNWEKKYQRHLDTQHQEHRSASVDDMNRDAKEAIETLRGILAHTLDIHDAVDWETLKRKDAFRIDPQELSESRKRPAFLQFNSYGRPTGFDAIPHPVEPTLEEIKKSYGRHSGNHLGLRQGFL